MLHHLNFNVNRLINTIENWIKMSERELTEGKFYNYIIICILAKSFIKARKYVMCDFVFKV